MMHGASTVTLWYLVSQADFLSKMTLLTLVFLSIGCWTIFFSLWSLCVLKSKQLLLAERLLQGATKIEDLKRLVIQLRSSDVGYLMSKTLACLKFGDNGDTQQVISSHEFEFVELSLEKAFEDICQKMKPSLLFLKVNAEVAPLLGLFGTVWGLVHSFMRISQQQSADIVTVAPGISEALITTWMGLLVAIPALIMFNIVLSKVSILEMRLLRMANQISWIVKNMAGRV
jgi:biopolymer transport protein TolQ